MPPTQRLRGFVSYSTQDCDRAAIVRQVLGTIDVDTFMAHDDIHVSQDWRTRILAELSQMQVFVPLLSAAFKDSEWAAQEVGYAVAKSDVLIIPASLDGTLPYGFISAIQGRQLPDPVTADFFRDAVGERYPRVVIGTLIEALAGAASWRGAEALFRPLLPFLSRMTREEAVVLATAATNNSEIWDAGLCRATYLPDFIKLNRHHLPPEILEPLEYQIQNGTWFGPDSA